MFEEMIFIDIMSDWQSIDAKHHARNDAMWLIARFENRQSVLLGPKMNDRMMQRVKDFIETELKGSTSNVRSIRSGISQYPAPQAGQQKEAQANGNTNLIARAFSFINQRPSWL